jgi:hypothetical protein
MSIRRSGLSRHTTAMDGGSAENAGAIFCLSIHAHSPLRPSLASRGIQSIHGHKKRKRPKPLNCTVTLFFWLLSLRGNEHHKAVDPSDYTSSIQPKSNYP